jgi:GTP-binding protein
MKTVVIIGRNNVGKSALFNRLAGRKLSLTSSKPGCTIDSKDTTLEIDYKSFKLIDTPALILERGHCPSQISTALSKAHIILFAVDPDIRLEDFNIAKYLYKHNKNMAKVILVVNKSEKADPGDSNCYSLGFAEVTFASAKSGFGIRDLLAKLNGFLPEEHNAEPPKNEIKIAIIGKPNVGKSTLINRLAGYDRVVTSPVAGTTRDSVWIDILHKSQNIKLFDTAGIRKNSGSLDELERLSVKVARLAIEHADVVVLLISSENGLTRQDLNIANFVISTGRALVIAVNKCDLLPSVTYKAHITRMIQTYSFISNCPIIMLSALHGDSCTELLNGCLNIYNLWCKKITTSALNRWLRLLSNDGSLSEKGNSIKLKYITQVGTKPLSFVVFVSKKPKINYTRYFERELKDFFGLSSMHIKTKFRMARVNCY